MRASITTGTDAPHRVEPHRRTTRAAAIVLALAAFHFASGMSAFVAKGNAQGLLPGLATQPDPDRLVRAELVADAGAVVAGRPFRLAVRFRISDGWHVNWINPGDAGLAPGVEWRLPEGFKASLVCWPYPERFAAGPLVIFGYAKELLLVTEVTPPSRLAVGSRVDLRAEVTWLACEEVCIPGSASLSLTLPVAAEGAGGSPESRLIDEWHRRCPGPSGAWSVDASLGDRATLLLDLQFAEQLGTKLERAFFYPYEPGVIENAAPQLLSIMEGPRGRAAYRLRVELSRIQNRVPDRARGVLVMSTGSAQAIEVDVPVRKR